MGSEYLLEILLFGVKKCNIKFDQIIERIKLRSIIAMDRDMTITVVRVAVLINKDTILRLEDYSLSILFYYCQIEPLNNTMYS